jgi:hypothetical protein
MAITSLFKTSETVDAKGKGDISTWTQVFRLEVDADHTPNELVELDFVGPPAMPRLRTRPYADKRWIVRNVEFAPVDYRIWQATVTLVTRLYTDVVPPDNDVTTGSGNRIWWSMSRRAIGVTTDWWIQPASIPTDFDSPWVPTSAIAGSRIDLAGHPFKQPMWRHEVFLTTFFERAYRRSVNANYWNARAYYGLDSAINKRNEAEFLGYPIGQIALVGFDEQPSEDPWQSVTLRFVATTYGHLEQRPLTGPDGQLLLSTTITIAGKTIKQNDAAWWYQPYPLKFDFNSLSTFDEITNPSPSW